MRKCDEISNPRSCWNKARPNERLFVILDRDLAMAGTIRDWIARRIKLKLNRANDDQIIEAENLARDLESEQGVVYVPAEFHEVCRAYCDPNGPAASVAESGYLPVRDLAIFVAEISNMKLRFVLIHGAKQVHPDHDRLTRLAGLVNDQAAKAEVWR